MLEREIEARSRKKRILLMAHAVLGYPGPAPCLEVIGRLARGEADLLELQIPCPDPVADGPVIRRANEQAILAGASPAACLGLVREAAQRFPGRIVVMTYYSTVCGWGVNRFAESAARCGAAGVIVPDLPPEDGAPLLEALRGNGLAPILILTRTDPARRIDRMSTLGGGFLYCVTRAGVTGAATRFDSDVAAPLLRCRRASTLPLAAGFGVSSRADVAFLEGRVQIAAIGTELIRRLERGGLEAVEAFLLSLRSPRDAFPPS
ncbi:MAG: tryptophan synthase subunit alpha [Deltaproteobacteria bacterium]|nr:tryptophan synthase subunit alpha [Deltaproteobacteria bacterium]